MGSTPSLILFSNAGGQADGFRRFGQRKAVGNQWAHVELARKHEPAKASVPGSGTKTRVKIRVSAPPSGNATERTMALTLPRAFPSIL